MTSPAKDVEVLKDSLPPGLQRVQVESAALLLLHSTDQNALQSCTTQVFIAMLTYAQAARAQLVYCGRGQRLGPTCNRTAENK